MKRVLLMITLSLFPRMLAAQSLDIDALLGENWYGLYLNGHKSGYCVNKVSKDAAGVVAVEEDAQFRITMGGINQDMRIFSKRLYAPDGALRSIDSHVDDQSGKSVFQARIENGEMLLDSTVGGATKHTRMPRPKETLKDALKHAELVGRNAKVGDTLEYSVFEPMYEKEMNAKSIIVGEEQRILDGVPTKVFKIKTRIDLMGVETMSAVTQDGTTLEDVVAGIITMRLEPKDLAKDVSYSNDVIVSNAARISRPIANPRKRRSLRLRLKGPLTTDHLFNDERQHLDENGGGFDFTAGQIALEGLVPVQIPVTNPDVAEWTKPTLFVQSDNPRLIAKAREIVGEEKDALKISAKLCAWVHQNVRTTFSARLTNALEVLDNLEGDCTEHSILFIGLARAIGLPAREVAGLVYVDGEDSGFYFHQWAKVWVGKWIDVDPTFNQPLADVTHIKLAEGDLFTQAKLIPIIGQIKVEVVGEPAAG